jgi:RNA polymerase sigma factor (sigma-70 family)
MSDDGELLRQFAATHDEACFEQIVQRHIGFVFAVCLRRLRDPHSAQDATQAVFIALARKAAAVARAPSVIGWLHRSTCYETYNLMRSQANRIARETEALCLGTISSQAAPETTAIEAILDEVLHQLPNHDREAILARYFSGQSYLQIGATFRLSENAARMRVDRALSKLRDRLQRRGITSTAAALAVALPACASTPVPAGMAMVVSSGSVAGAAAALGAVSFWAFMSTAKIAASAAVIVAIASTAFQYHHARQLEAELASAQEERAATTKQIGALKLQINALKECFPEQQGPAQGAPVFGVAATPPKLAPGITPKAPNGWHKNGSANNFYEVGVDETQPWGGMPSAYAKSTGPVDGQFGGMMQTISGEMYKNQRVQLSGWIKTEEADDGGGHLWLRVDGSEKGDALKFDNMDGRAPKGTTDWQEYSVVLDVPPEATTLNYGFFVQGKGKIWVNGMTITPVGPEVPTTNIPLHTPPSLPKKPVNLGFFPPQTK